VPFLEHWFWWLPISAKFRVWFGICCILLATGCQQGVTHTAQTQTTIRVELSSTLQYLSPAIQACSLRANGLHIILEGKPASEMGKTGADVSLRWGDSNIDPSARVFRLGSDRLIFAVHKENPLKVLTVEQASFLSKGGFGIWKDILEQYCPECSASDAFSNQSLEPWQYPTGEDIMLEIARIPSISQSGSHTRTWMAPNPQALAAAVSNNTAAVGWLPARWLNENLKEITLQDINPADLIIPVLALTPQKPQPVVDDWLNCLQSSYNN
jgi:hypothetical protein